MVKVDGAPAAVPRGWEGRVLVGTCYEKGGARGFCLEGKVESPEVGGGVFSRDQDESESTIIRGGEDGKGGGGEVFVSVG